MRRNLAASRAHAVELIESHQVLVSGVVADKASRLVGLDEPVTVTAGPPRFVSRGGLKLDGALDGFGIDVLGCRALDAGASTGGFSDCLLQRGASEVVAVDVGRAQLHESLRVDPRMLVHESTDIRVVTADQVGGEFDIVVADLAFISLRSVAQQLADLAKPGGDLVVLVKPQFEAGRREASRGRGVIRDPDVWRSALQGAINALERAGTTMMGVMASPLRGADGNVEFFVHLHRAAGAVHTTPPDEAIARAVEDAGA